MVSWLGDAEDDAEGQSLEFLSGYIRAQDYVPRADRSPTPLWNRS